jgi:WD40 repeat protein
MQWFKRMLGGATRSRRQQRLGFGVGTGAIALSMALMPVGLPPVRAIAAEPPTPNPVLSESQIARIAEDVTVAIAGGNLGTGAIVDRSGDVYTVLTTNAVLAGGESYQVRTADGRRHPVAASSVKRFPLVDLATIAFTSEVDYPVATFGPSEGDRLYLSATAPEGPTLVARADRFDYPTVNLSAGYGLIYTSPLQPTTQGGVLFDPWGRVVAIRGQFDRDGTPVNGAIAIEQFLELAPRVGLNLGWRGMVRSNWIRVGQTIAAIALSSDGAIVANDAGYDAIQLWEVRSGKLLGTLSGHGRTVSSLAMSPDRRWLVSGSDDGVRVWDWRSGRIARSIAIDRARENGPIADLAILPPSRDPTAPDDLTLVTASGFGVRLWNLETGELLDTLEGSAGAEAIAIAADGRTLASAHQDNTVKIWTVDSGELLSTLNAETPEYPMEAVAIDRAGETVAGGTYGEFKMWDLQRGIRKLTVRGHGEKALIRALAFSPDGRAIASASDDGVKIWSLPQGQLLRHLHRPAIDLAFSPDGRTLMVGGSDIETWQIPF